MDNDEPKKTALPGQECTQPISILQLLIVEPQVLIIKCTRDPHEEHSRCGHKSVTYLVLFLEVNPNEYSTNFCLPTKKQKCSRMERDRCKSYKAPKHLTIASSTTQIIPNKNG
jgi:hypothetical protein